MRHSQGNTWCASVFLAHFLPGHRRPCWAAFARGSSADRSPALCSSTMKPFSPPALLGDKAGVVAWIWWLSWEAPSTDGLLHSTQLDCHVQNALLEPPLMPGSSPPTSECNSFAQTSHITPKGSSQGGSLGWARVSYIWGCPRSSKTAETKLKDDSLESPTFYSN